MLTAHFDESYGDGVFVIAGYVAPSKTWEKFSDEWQGVLSQHPRLKYFHMVEANARTGEFANWDVWSPEKIAARSSALVTVVEHHADDMFGILSVVRTADIKTFIPESLYGYPYSNPYHFCFNRVILSTRQARDERGLRDRVKFVFDNQNRLGIDVRSELPKMLKYVNSQWRGFIAGAPLFADDKDVMALQAADMVAWHLRRVAQNASPDDDPVLKRLMKPGFNHGWMSQDAWTWQFVLPMLNMFFFGKPGSPEEMQNFGDSLRKVWGELDRRDPQENRFCDARRSVCQSASPDLKVRHYMGS